MGGGKRQLVIFSRNGRLLTTRRLLEEGVKTGCAVQWVDPLRLRTKIGTGAESKSGEVWLRRQRMKTPDFLLARVGTLWGECGLAAARIFELAGCRVCNTTRALMTARDKMMQLVELQGAGLPVPATLLHRDDREIDRSIQQVGGAPLVLKTLRGSQGLGVMKADTPGAAASIMQTLWGLERSVLLQAFRPTNGHADVRVIVIGGRVIAAMRRWAKPGEFRSNIHRGGRAEPVTVTRELKQLAVKTAKVLRLDIAGVDLLEGPEGWEILEVNTSPGVAKIEKVTGVNVAAAIVEHLVQG
jgi:ribosomal protein S6--L-glutamate ligase